MAAASFLRRAALQHLVQQLVVGQKVFPPQRLLVHHPCRDRRLLFFLGFFGFPLRVKEDKTLDVLWVLPRNNAGFGVSQPALLPALSRPAEHPRNERDGSQTASLLATG